MDEDGTSLDIVYLGNPWGWEIEEDINFNTADIVYSGTVYPGAVFTGTDLNNRTTFNAMTTGVS